MRGESWPRGKKREPCGQDISRGLPISPRVLSPGSITSITSTLVPDTLLVSRVLIKLYHAIKEDGWYRLPLSKISTWLQNQESFSLYKPIHREFKRLKVIIGGLHDQYNADLADMLKLKEKNDGVRFLLIVIDVFSCHLQVEPLLNKTEESVIEAFWCIFQRTPKLWAVTNRPWR